MTNKLEKLAMLLIVIAIGINFYYDKVGQKRDVLAKNELDNCQWELITRTTYLEARIDSLKNSTHKVAKATIYLDSCQQVKATKSDRAERRGKFVGGLLRGLFPGM